MKPRRRPSGRPRPAPEVVDLSVDDDSICDAGGGDAGAAAGAAAAAAAGNAGGGGGSGVMLPPSSRKAAGAAAAALAKGAAAAAAECDAELLDSEEEEHADDGSDAAATPPSKATQGRKRLLGSGSGGAAAAADAAGKAGSRSKQQPAAKRAKTTTAARGGSAKGRSAKPAPALSNKQAASKGFSALFLSASQPPAATGGGSQQQQVGSGSPLSPPAAAAAGPSQQAASQEAAAAVDADAAAQLWVDKHEPSSLDGLVVHKKKVAEVSDWLSWYVAQRKACHTRALLISGPPGCGKSVTLRVVAASLGFEVTEWTPPVPTTWADHQYIAGAGVRYSSKLDEFETFVARCKFAALPLSCAPSGSHQQQQQQPASGSSQQLPSPPRRQQQEHAASATQHQQQHQQQQHQKLILVEDLPHVADAERRARLASALRDLATTARCPVVVITTSEEGSSGGGGGGGGRGGGYGGGGYGGGGGGGAGIMSSKGLHKDFVAVLEQVGAGAISFNPITANNTAKALAAIAEAEGAALLPDTALGLATAAAGDLRNAITSLQLLLQGLGGAAAAAAAGKAGGSKKGKAPRKPRKGSKTDPAAAAASEAAQAKVAGQVGRDQHLSVFHAVGKLLHYKREAPDADAGADGAAEGGGGGTAAAAAAGAAAAAAATAGGDSQEQQQPQPEPHPLSRPPLRISPEDVVQGSGLEALSVTAFLGENYLHFLADDAMEQAAAAASYLSDAAFLACFRNSSAPSVAFWDEGDANAGSISAAAASSVATRGVLFANTRPAPSRWLPLHGPSCFLPDRASGTNTLRLSQALQALQDDWGGSGSGIGAAASAPGAGQQPSQAAVLRLAPQLLHAGRTERAAQVLPFLQALARQPARLWVHQLLPRSWAYVWSGAITERAAPAMQGGHAAAVRAAFAAAAVAAAAAAAASGGGGGSSQQCVLPSQQQHHAAGGTAPGTAAAAAAGHVAAEDFDNAGGEESGELQDEIEDASDDPATDGGGW